MEALLLLIAFNLTAFFFSNSISLKYFVDEYCLAETPVRADTIIKNKVGSILVWQRILKTIKQQNK